MNIAVHEQEMSSTMKGRMADYLQNTYNRIQKKMDAGKSSMRIIMLPQRGQVDYRFVQEYLIDDDYDVEVQAVPFLPGEFDLVIDWSGRAQKAQGLR